MRLKCIVLFLMLIGTISGCKSTKDIQKDKVKVDSLRVEKVDSVNIKKTDSLVHIKIDSSISSIAVINFKYDSAEKKPYVSKVVLYHKENNKKEAVSQVKTSNAGKVQKADSTALNKTEKTSSKQKETKGILPLNLIWLIPVVALVIVVIKYWSKIKLIFQFIR